ncbi:MAG TPA: NADP-dependent oxidoreductase [Candidatus Dormibacteraeota bacterium]|nr:NADP-dependent oxidoreductase [Candidatus Dormibacteraeota bacterium]
MATNHQFKLAARPIGLPKRSDWDFVESTVPQPGDGEVLVRVNYISLDPAMRGWMNEGRSYIRPVELGEVMRAGVVGQVVESKAPGLAEGDYVTGTLGVQEYATAQGRHVVKIDKSLAPLPTYLGTLGMPGITAYFGLLDVGQMKEGQTVVVSGAAGAVGSVVGQVARIKGGRAVGLAGGPEKCAYLVDELGFDAAIDYKAGELSKRLREACPDRINIYFDNVGGEVLDTCLMGLALHARVVICGAISQYNNTSAVAGPSNYMSLLVNRARMEGFVVFDYADRYAEAVMQMAQWIDEGKLKTREEIVDGIETFPETLLKLFNGENTGKLLLKIADE